jgi:hypothetical protein
MYLVPLGHQGLGFVDVLLQFLACLLELLLDFAKFRLEGVSQTNGHTWSQYYDH